MCIPENKYVVSLLISRLEIIVICELNYWSNLIIHLRYNAKGLKLLFTMKKKEDAVKDDENEDETENFSLDGCRFGGCDVVLLAGGNKIEKCS
jgi:hypothetical protein